MTWSPRVAAALQLGPLTLLSAFLLFQVQPIIGKFILPWFGGSPGVWTTCMLFFQVVLCAGYAYAHGLTRLPLRWQGIVHGALVLAAVAVLPIAPGVEWKPTGMEDPAGRILLLLLANVALPYFALSGTSPLVQVWCSRSGAPRAPWRLYALSNAGSLGALLSYPFFFEPRLDVTVQTWMWSAAFVLFALLSWWGAYADWRRNRAPGAEAGAAGKADGSATAVAPRWWRRLLWLVLPAVASVLLLAGTNHLCRDVAVIPFLWVLPLSLYLLTFIICFEHERWYVRVLWGLPAMALLHAAARGGELPWDSTPDFQTGIITACGAVFLGCMVCHGELARLKPDPRHLTEFYLIMSAGGALGGLFVTLAAPRLFTTYLEWPGVLVCAFGITAAALVAGAWRLRRRWVRVVCVLAVAAVAVRGLVSMGGKGFEVAEALERVRNFYGTLSVEESEEELQGVARSLIHSGTIHGMQYLAEELRGEPATYYGKDTGIGRALLTLNNRTEARIGIVGMGTATAAAYGRRGHRYRFYEINPEIVRIARQYFTYLEDLEKRGGVVEVVLGDARCTLERESPQRFDVLLLDAFSGDSVPAHLLTREAFEIYLRHMGPDGIIVVHVSNMYLSLAPVVEKVAASLGWNAVLISSMQDDLQDMTDYVVVTNNAGFLKDNPGSGPDGTPLQVRLWTDRRHNLFEILMKD